MALSQYSWSTTAKLALPLLVMMAIAAAPSVSGAAQVEQIDLPEPEEQAAPVATAGRGRFFANYDDEIPLTSRRLLTANFCSQPPKFANCSQLFPSFQIPGCCQDPITLISNCWDLGILNLKCGSCTNQCAWNQVCCKGVCVNLQNETNNCGVCGKKCNKVPCINFLCGYNGKV